MRWEVKWEPQKGALGVQLFPEDSTLSESELTVVRGCVPFFIAGVKLVFFTGSDQSRREEDIEGRAT